MGDWKEIRECLTVQVEHLLLSIRAGDVIVTECPECSYRYPHVVGKIQTVMPVVDFIIEQMNEYELKYQHEWANMVIKTHYNAYWADEIERYDCMHKYPDVPEPGSLYRQAREIIDAWMERQGELQKK